MKTFTLFILFFLSTLTYASSELNGLWTGTGQLQIKGRPSAEDCQLILEIEQNETTFTVIRSDYSCPSMHIKNKAQNTLKIANHRLYLNNVERGYIDDNTMYSFYNTTDGLIQSYLMKVDAIAETLVYSDQVDWSKGLSTTLTGNLKKTNP